MTRRRPSRRCTACESPVRDPHADTCPAAASPKSAANRMDVDSLVELRAISRLPLPPASQRADLIEVAR